MRNGIFAALMLIDDDDKSGRLKKLVAPGASRGLAGERSVVCGRAGGGRRDCVLWGGLARDGGFVACVIPQCVHDHALSTVV